MTRYEKLSSSKEELIKFLINIDSSEEPWQQWFGEVYCTNCEHIKCTYSDIFPNSEHANKETICAFCELYDKCRYFPKLDNCPSTEQVINLWLDSEE